jgi:hypothetical protein
MTAVFLARERALVRERRLRPDRDVDKLLRSRDLDLTFAHRGIDGARLARKSGEEDGNASLDKRVPVLRERPRSHPVRGGGSLRARELDRVAGKEDADVMALRGGRARDEHRERGAGRVLWAGREMNEDLRHEAEHSTVRPGRRTTRLLRDPAHGGAARSQVVGRRASLLVPLVAVRIPESSESVSVPTTRKTHSPTSSAKPGDSAPGTTPQSARASRSTPALNSSSGSSTTSEHDSGGRFSGAQTAGASSAPAESSSVWTDSSTRAVNWSAVSERGRWILRSVAVPLSAGYLPTEVAKAAGVEKRDLDDLLDELAAELER